MDSQSLYKRAPPPPIFPVFVFHPLTHISTFISLQSFIDFHRHSLSPSISHSNLLNTPPSTLSSPPHATSLPFEPTLDCRDGFLHTSLHGSHVPRVVGPRLGRLRGSQLCQDGRGGPEDRIPRILLRIRTGKPEQSVLLSTLTNQIIQADLIRVMHGTPAYEKFIDETRLKREAEATQRTERLARRRARSAALKGAYHRLTALFTKQPA